MKVAIYGKHFGESFAPAIQFLFNHLVDAKIEVMIYHPFCKDLFGHVQLPASYQKFKTAEELCAENPELVLSIGGDGTILDAVTMVRQTEIPILGINTGRLGFLSSIAREEIAIAVQAIIRKSYTIEDRTLLSLSTEADLFGHNNFALNELTVLKKDSSSLITVHTFVDEQYLNSYWADGLIIATPTGSTAYSLSCGGPILVPDAGSFVITPISPHNLNVRPIVVRDESEIKVKIEGRDERFLVALDSRTETVDPLCELRVRKAGFKVRLARLDSENFYITLRNKLMWGLDKRN